MRNILLRSTQSIFLILAVMTPKLNTSMLFIFHPKASQHVSSLCELAALSSAGFLELFCVIFFPV